MPGVTEALRDLATTNINSWTEAVITEFIKNLSSQSRLADALKSREPLKKAGIPFPTRDDTTIEEIDAALEAINRGDNSVYRQDPRPLFLLGEEEFGLTQMQALITPADILCYEAAAFGALAPVEGVIAAAHVAVLSDYPFDDAEIIAAKHETIALIKKELAKVLAKIALAKIAYEKTLACIVDNPEIPEEDQQQAAMRARQNTARKFDVVTLTSETEWLKNEYLRIKANLNQRYDALKQALREFIPAIPAALKSEGEAILTNLGRAEERQAASLLASTGSALISEFLAKAQTQIRTIIEQCERIESSLSQTARDAFIRPEYKEEFNTHLAAFNARKNSLPADQRLTQAETLRHEGEEAYKRERTQRKLEQLQAELTAAKETLTRSLLADPKIPETWKTKAQDLMERASANEHDIATIKQTHANLLQEIKAITEGYRTHLSRLEALASEITIPSIQTEVTGQLSAARATQSSATYDVLDRECPSLSSFIKATREKHALLKAKEELTSILRDPRLISSWRTEADSVIAANNRDQIILVSKKIKANITDISQQFTYALERLRRLASYSDIGAHFREQAQALLTSASESEQALNYDQLSSKAQEINSTIVALKEQDALEKRKIRLQEIVANPRIPEDLKILASQLLLQPAPTEQDVTTTIRQIQSAISRISKFCQAVQGELSAELLRAKNYFYQQETTASLQSFEEAIRAESPWANLENLATNLNKEIIAVKAYNRMHALLARIEDLRQHADSMPQGSKKRAAIDALVRNLTDQIKTYLGQIRTAENPLTDVKHQDFENQFKTTLLDKDTMKVMRQYRTPGRLIANILLACTVFGGILMLIRAAMMATRQLQQKEKPSLTLNQVGFFAKTRSEQDIEAINDALLAARPVETGLR